MLFYLYSKIVCHWGFRLINAFSYACLWSSALFFTVISYWTFKHLRNNTVLYHGLPLAGVCNEWCHNTDCCSVGFWFDWHYSLGSIDGGVLCVWQIGSIISTILLFGNRMMISSFFVSCVIMVWVSTLYRICNAELRFSNERFVLIDFIEIVVTFSS